MKGFFIIKKKSNKIVIAKFGKTHGVKGQISVHSFLSQKSDILKFKDFFLDGDIKIDIELCVNSKKILGIVNNINDTKIAKKFIGKQIFIDKGSLPKLKRNQFYFNDLISLNVFVKTIKLGKVKDVKNHGAGDYLEVSKKKEDILVPLNNDHVQLIDLENEMILLNPEYYEF